MDKNCHSLKESDPGKAYSILKRMGAQPGDMLSDGSFYLLNHIEANLTNQESVKKIADHFAKINQEYQPFDNEELSQGVKVKIAQK